MPILDILKHKFTCHKCGKKIKVDESKHDIITNVWFKEGEISTFKMTLCNECYEPIKDIVLNVIAKRSMINKKDKQPKHYDNNESETEW